MANEGTRDKYNPKLCDERHERIDVRLNQLDLKVNTMEKKTTEWGAKLNILIGIATTILLTLISSVLARTVF